jgi:hypothetical protein
VGIAHRAFATAREETESEGENGRPAHLGSLTEGFRRVGFG